MTSRPDLNIIVAVTADNAIGRGGDLVYRLGADMKHFKQTTMGHPIVMGRKTWESLPAGALPGRRNIVISRNTAFVAEGAEVFQSIDEALADIKADEQVFVIGGAQIYEATLPHANRLYLTRIDATAPDADTFFPPIDTDHWEVESESDTRTDDKTGLQYSFVCLKRK